MKVRVKKGKKVFYDNKMRNEGEEFTLAPREHSVDVDEKGKPIVISVESQFSVLTMEKVKTAGRPKADKKDEDK